MTKSKILYIFTRTPLHVGAGASVGAIDQPVQRERHTGFPIIPASSLKGSFADHWNDTLVDGKRAGGSAAWLFGSDDANASSAGALLFGEGRLLAFPIRSAKGSFAWITCPLILRRAARDGVLQNATIEKMKTPTDEQALYDGGTNSPLDLGGKIVLEEYTLNQSGIVPPSLAAELSKLFPEDPVWREVASRLVILSDGMMSFFAQNACEVAQHVKISDETGTAEPGALFNQENVPSETLFYAVMHSTNARLKTGEYTGRKAEDALNSFEAKLNELGVFQFGGDASTGHGYCTVKLS